MIFQLLRASFSQVRWVLNNFESIKARFIGCSLTVFLAFGVYWYSNYSDIPDEATFKISINGPNSPLSQNEINEAIQFAKDKGYFTITGKHPTNRPSRRFIPFRYLYEIINESGGLIDNGVLNFDITNRCSAPIKHNGLSSNFPTFKWQLSEPYTLTVSPTDDKTGYSCAIYLWEKSIFPIASAY